MYPLNNEVKLQGAAGSEAKIEILKGTQLTDLRDKNWLINDASLTFYINQDSDTTNTANQLYLYKRGEDLNSNPISSHIKDIFTEGLASFGGFLEKEEDKKDRYTFRITDYLSDILSGETDYNPPLRLKVYNTSEIYKQFQILFLQIIIGIRKQSQFLIIIWKMKHHNRKKICLFREK